MVKQYDIVGVRVRNDNSRAASPCGTAAPRRTMIYYARDVSVPNT